MVFSAVVNPKVLVVGKNTKVVPNNTQSTHRLFDGSKALVWGVRQKSRVVPKN